MVRQGVLINALKYIITYKSIHFKQVESLVGPNFMEFIVNQNFHLINAIESNNESNDVDGPFLSKEAELAARKLIAVMVALSFVHKYKDILDYSTLPKKRFSEGKFENFSWTKDFVEKHFVEKFFSLAGIVENEMKSVQNWNLFGELRRLVHNYSLVIQFLECLFIYGNNF